MKKPQMIKDIMRIVEMTRPDLTKNQRDEYRRKLNSLTEPAVRREWRNTIPEDMQYEGGWC